MEAAAIATAKPAIKVAALCGSLRKGSINRGLLRAAMKLCSESIEGVQIEFVDIAPLPMLNTDLEVNGRFPPVVEAFREKIRETDCFLFACPEYNYSVTDSRPCFSSLHPALHFVGGGGPPPLHPALLHFFGGGDPPPRSASPLLTRFTSTPLASAPLGSTPAL